MSAPSDAELRAIVREALRQIAHEADLEFEIPEADSAQLRSLADGVAYLRRRLGPASP